MSLAEWAFALRWTAQDLLSRSGDDGRLTALHMLFKAYDLGDANAAWELAVFAKENGVDDSRVDWLIHWAANAGSVDAAMWMRDRWDISELEKQNWERNLDAFFSDRKLELHSPPTTDVSRVQDLIYQLCA